MWMRATRSTCRRRKRPLWPESLERRLVLSQILVASGDVTQHDAVLWALSNAVGDVEFEVAVDESFSHVVDSAIVAVGADLDPVKVEITGLDSGQDYFYRATHMDGAMATGRFVTAPEATTHSGLSFGASSEFLQTLAPAGAFSAISDVSDAELDFFISLGGTAFAENPPNFPPGTLPPLIPAVTSSMVPLETM